MAYPQYTVLSAVLPSLQKQSTDSFIMKGQNETKYRKLQKQKRHLLRVFWHLEQVPQLFQSLKQERYLVLLSYGLTSAGFGDNQPQ